MWAKIYVGKDISNCTTHLKSMVSTNLNHNLRLVTKLATGQCTRTN